MEVRKIVYNGSSFILTIPPTYARELGLKSGQVVEIQLNENRELIISPLARRLEKRSHAPR